MRKILVILILSLTINVSAAEPDKLTEHEKLQLEYYVLKVKDINNIIRDLETKRLPYIKSYQDYYATVMKNHKKDSNKWNIDLDTGNFVPKEEEKKPSDNKKTK